VVAGELAEGHRPQVFEPQLSLGQTVAKVEKVQIAKQRFNTVYQPGLVFTKAQQIGPVDRVAIGEFN
jgi:hypothetical protein